MKPKAELTSASINCDNQAPEQRKQSVADRLKALIPLTFRGQAVLFLFPLIVIISLGYTIESITTERKILRNEIIKKGETIAAVAARNAELSLLSENREQLKNSALPLMAIKDVAFVSFLNTRSEVLHHEGIKHPIEEKLVLDPDSAVRFFEYADFFEFIVPVVTVKATEGLFLLEGTSSAPPVREQIGWVCIGFSKEVMRKSEQQI
ncbi:MAG: hypothetical protein WC007_16845, partial [Pelobacteraceae bacterium]